MMDELFPKRHPRRIIDLNIVPILDMLTTVIFFLLLSTSFMEYTKLTVPPSKTTVQTDPVAPPPLQPKILVARLGFEVQLQLIWSGAQGGELREKLTELDPYKRRGQLYELVKKMTKEFTTKFPREKSLQVGLGPDMPYQDLITTMDGIRESQMEVVLIAPTETQIRVRSTQ